MADRQQKLWATKVHPTSARNVRRLIEVLAFRFKEWDKCIPKNTAIAKAIGCHERTVTRITNLASELGVVEKVERKTGGGQSSNEYIIQWERVRAFCEVDPIEGSLPSKDSLRWKLLNSADFTRPPRGFARGAVDGETPATPPRQLATPPRQLVAPPRQPVMAYKKELSTDDLTEVSTEGDAAPPPSPAEAGEVAADGGDGDAAVDSPPYGLIVQAWNAAMVQRCTLTKKRRGWLKARWADPWWREHWREAIARARASPFLAGDNDRGWRADLDFFLRPDSAAKILEGKYDDHKRRSTIVGPGQHYAGTPDW